MSTRATLLKLVIKKKEGGVDEHTGNIVEVGNNFSITEDGNA